MGNISDKIKKYKEVKKLTSYLSDYPIEFSNTIIREFYNLNLTAREAMKFIPDFSLVDREKALFDSQNMKQDMASALLAIEFMKNGEEIKRATLEPIDWFYKKEKNKKQEKYKRFYCFSKKEFALSVRYHNLDNELELWKKQNNKFLNSLEQIEEKINEVFIERIDKETKFRTLEDIIQREEIKQKQLFEELNLLEKEAISSRSRLLIVHDIEDSEKNLFELGAQKELVLSSIDKLKKIIELEKIKREKLLSLLDSNSKCHLNNLKQEKKEVKEELKKEQYYYLDFLIKHRLDISICKRISSPEDKKEYEEIIQKKEQEVLKYSQDPEYKGECYRYKK